MVDDTIPADLHRVAVELRNIIQALLADDRYPLPFSAKLIAAIYDIDSVLMGMKS